MPANNFKLRGESIDHVDLYRQRSQDYLALKHDQRRVHYHDEILQLLQNLTKEDYRHLRIVAEEDRPVPTESYHYVSVEGNEMISRYVTLDCGGPRDATARTYLVGKEVRIGGEFQYGRYFAIAQSASMGSVALSQISRYPALMQDTAPDDVPGVEDINGAITVFDADYLCHEINEMYKIRELDEPR